MSKMKKILSLLLAVVMVVSLMPVIAMADTVDSTSQGYHAADGTPATPGSKGTHDYFTWGPNAAAPEAPYTGILILNADDAQGNDKKTLTVHYKDGYFYCDEQCKVKVVSIGWETNTATWPNAINHQSGIANPGNMSNFSAAIRDRFYNFNTNNNFKTKNPPCLGDATGATYTLNVVLHSKYTVGVIDSTDFSAYEWNYAWSNNNTARKAWWGPTFSLGQESVTATAASDPNKTTIWGTTGVGRFLGKLNIVRGTDMIGKGTLLYMPAAPGIVPQFAPGDNTTIDNRTTDPDDVAIEMGAGTLLHLENTCITNSLYANVTDITQYQGIGVKLTGFTNDPEASGTIELGTDAGGSAKISKCRIGIEMDAGVTKFKAPAANDPFTVIDNGVSINMKKGTYLAKWTHNISGINPINVTTTLSNDNGAWTRGDVLFASGQTNFNINGTPGPRQNAPLIEDDLVRVIFVDSANVMNTYSINFDTSVANSVNYTYPRFVLAAGVIYNPRTNSWYHNLFSAVNETKAGFELADGDELIYFANVNEQRAVEIDKDITIRSAQLGLDERPDWNETIAGGYGSNWRKGDEATSFITVKNGAEVTLAKDYHIDCNNYGRAVMVEAGATLNLQDSVRLTDGTATDNKGTAIYQNGTLNVKGNFYLGDSNVYLPEGKVITKAGSISTGSINTMLADYTNGRDILVSGAGTVDSNDNSKIALTNWPNPNYFSKEYNATGRDGGNTPVIELQIPVYTVTYTDGVDGQEIFQDKVFSDIAKGSATPGFGNNPTWTNHTFKGWSPTVADIVTATVTYVAQWDVDCFHVVHSSDNSVQDIPIENLDEDGCYDLTTLVKAGYLYGGLAIDEDFEEPETNECGLWVEPVKDSVYYLREVSVDFLKPKMMTVKYSNVQPSYDYQHYLMTAIDKDGADNGFYFSYGFTLSQDPADIQSAVLEGSIEDPTDDTSSDEDMSMYALYKSIRVWVTNEEDVHTVYTPDDVFGSDVTANDYFGCVPLEAYDNFDMLCDEDLGYIELVGDEDKEEKSFGYVPYYVTADGVFVTGNEFRNVLTGSSNSITADGNFTKSLCLYYDSGETPVGITGLKMVAFSAFTMDPVAVTESTEDGEGEQGESGAAEEAATITVIANGEGSLVTVPYGDITDELEVPEFDGLLFAGWFEDAAFTTPADLSNVTEDMTVFARYIDATYFSVKATATVLKNKLSKIRVISVIDSTDYVEFGFKINADGLASEYAAEKLYTKVSSSNATKLFGAGAKSTDKMFYTDINTLNFAVGAEVEVIPYFVLSDGTVLYGSSTTLVCYADKAVLK